VENISDLKLFLKASAGHKYCGTFGPLAAICLPLGSGCENEYSPLTMRQLNPALPLLRYCA